MIKVYPYNRDALKDFVYNGVEKDFTSSSVTAIADYYAKTGDCYYISINDKVLGVGGVYPLWQGAGGCFLFINREAKLYGVQVYRKIVEYMDIMIKKYKINNLIVECLQDNYDANNLLQHLGFIRENEIKVAIYKKNLGEGNVR